MACILCLSPGRSVSMIDMRAEEETILQPHSQVRHELMHNQYNKMKEEEDHWQDVSISPSSLSFLLIIASNVSSKFLPGSRTWPSGRTAGGVFLRISSKKRRRGRWWSSCCQETPAPPWGEEALRPTERSLLTSRRTALQVQKMYCKCCTRQMKLPL